MPRSFVTIAAENSNSLFGKAVAVLLVSLLLLLGLTGVIGVCFYWPWMKKRWGWYMKWKTFLGNQFPMSRMGAFSMFFFALNVGLAVFLSRDLRDYHNVVVVLALLFMFGMWFKDYLNRHDDKKV
jgi:hypothetical protein